ncbi:hypothetical protein DPMN_045409 [Dreissena polymorpha]|uniref:Uncharacterized protein n=1 Tax=Dreissena polymorpha TaxID=45954 RepID=A0A9D4D441_DREPO|nr:hypothetical protein DPMN_045409 [Dreissena polymorpha]
MAECGYKTIWKLVNTTTNVKRTRKSSIKHEKKDDRIKLVTILHIKSVKETNVLTKVHEDWARNATSRVFTCLHYKQKEKTAPHPCGQLFFPPISTNFELKTAPTRATMFSTDQNHFRIQEATYHLHKHFGIVNVTSRNSVECSQGKGSRRTQVDQISP